MICLTEGCGVDVVLQTVFVTPHLAAFWALFVLVTTFGVLNQVIGLFCENSMKNALDREREISLGMDSVRRARLAALRLAFERIDTDQSGDLTRDEYLEGITENPDVM